MLEKTITYTDYNGNERTETLNFNLSKAELMEMELSVNGGMTTLIKRITEEQDNAKIMAMFKEILLKSYGVKSLDGRRFEKSPELSKEFEQTEAYSELLIELMSGGEEAVSTFINKVIPDLSSIKEVNKPNPIPPGK